MRRAVALLFTWTGATAAGVQTPAGMSWDSLDKLPPLLDAQWLPENSPGGERGLLRALPLPPLKPEFIDDARAEMARLRQGAALPTANCRADGQPRLAWYPYPLRFIYGAGNVMLQVGYQVRQIPMAGLKHPDNLTDPEALVGLQANGDARGVWDDDALVIDTIAVRDEVDLFYGVANDPQLHIVERYRLLNHDRLERITAIEAPNTFTRPWIVRTTYRRGPAGSYASVFCEPKGGWFTEQKSAGPVTTPVSARTPSAGHGTPAMTWESIQHLPKLWGVGWLSPAEYDATQIVLTALTYPPLQPEPLARAHERIAKILAGKAEFKQASCAPSGMARSVWYTGAPVFLFQPGGRLILAQMGEFREIWMDGRAHPAAIDPREPALKYNGHSIGWWEGDALVIDTVGVHPGHELFYGVAYGGPSHIVERYELQSAQQLRVSVTVEAPAVLEKPWTFVKTFTSVSGRGGLAGGPEGDGGGAGTFNCTPENSRQKVDAAGNVHLDLTPPPPGIK